MNLCHELGQIPYQILQFPPIFHLSVRAVIAATGSRSADLKSVRGGLPGSRPAIAEYFLPKGNARNNLQTKELRISLKKYTNRVENVLDNERAKSINDSRQNC